MTDRELQTINAILKNKDINVLFEAASDELFTTYSDVWGSIKSYYNKYHAVPDISVVKERHPDLEVVEVPAATEHYMNELRDEYVKTRLENIIVNADKALQANGSSAVLGKLQESLSRLNKFTAKATDLNIMDMEEADRHYEHVRERTAALGGLPGIPTGVSFIDSAYTSGLAPGDLVVMLGWTGRAKSLFSTLVCCHAHDLGFTPMIASMEMSGAKVRDRVYTIKGSGLFRNSSLALGDISVDSFRDFAKKNEDSPPFIVITNDDGEITPNLIESRIDQYSPSLVVIDYAQLGSDNEHSENTTVRMMNMSKQYKLLAVKKQVIIVLISSATAESATSSDDPPTIEQVAWSRQLAYDADLAFAVHKHDDSNLVQIVCRKNRNGPLFAGYLDWDIDQGIIKEVA